MLTNDMKDERSLDQKVDTAAAVADRVAGTVVGKTADIVPGVAVVDIVGKGRAQAIVLEVDRAEIGSSEVVGAMRLDDTYYPAEAVGVRKAVDAETAASGTDSAETVVVDLPRQVADRAVAHSTVLLVPVDLAGKVETGTADTAAEV